MIGMFLRRSIELLRHKCFSKPLNTAGILCKFSNTTMCLRKNDDQIKNTPGAFKCRRATLDDYAEVMSLRNPSELFGGYDNLPDRYQKFISDPNTKGYILAKEDEVVGFLITFLVDNSETAVSYGLRIAKHLEGFDVVRAFLRLVCKDLQPCKYFATCIDTNTKSRHSSGVFVCNANMVMQHELFPFRAIKETLTNANSFNIKKNTDIKILGMTDINRIFCYSALSKSLFPDMRILKLWCPYRLMPTNVSLIMDSRTTIVGSGLAEDEKINALLTLGTYSFTKMGFFYNMDCYGNLERGFKEHMLIHIKKILQFITCTSNVILEISMNVKSSSIINVGLMKDMGFETIENYGNRDLFCYELELANFSRLLFQKDEI